MEENFELENPEGSLDSLEEPYAPEGVEGEGLDALEGEYYAAMPGQLACW